MKKTLYRLIMVFTLPILFSSCLKEDNVSELVIKDVKLFMKDVRQQDSLVTTVTKGNEVKIVVYTDADMVSVWPGGIREVMKKTNGLADSIDMFNHPVLVVSDSYSDYGLVKARGLNTTVQNDGWYVSYVYPNAGQFDLIMVAGNHGYDGPHVKQLVHKAGKITVK